MQRVHVLRTREVHSPWSHQIIAAYNVDKPALYPSYCLHYWRRCTSCTRSCIVAGERIFFTGSEVSHIVSAAVRPDQNILILDDSREKHAQTFFYCPNGSLRTVFIYMQPNGPTTSSMITHKHSSLSARKFAQCIHIYAAKCTNDKQHDHLQHQICVNNYHHLKICDNGIWMQSHQSRTGDVVENIDLIVLLDNRISSHAIAVYTFSCLWYSNGGNIIASRSFLTSNGMTQSNVL